MRWIVRIFVLLLASSAVLVIAGPWMLYWVGLHNIDGRPTHSTAAAPAPEEQAALLRQLRVPSADLIRPLTPWDVELAVLTHDTSPHRPRSGSDVAWQIARRYNSTHLKDRRMLWWHLSGAALTIWITRNWSSSDILSEATLLERSMHASN